MSIKRNDDAVSPVIGVILMVAITVILAAVIAAFVFGLVGNVQGAKIVGLTVTSTQNAAGGEITWQGGADISNLQTVEILVNNNLTTYSGARTVGTITYIPDYVVGNRTVITGTFKDGSSQVIFDKQF